MVHEEPVRFDEWEIRPAQRQLLVRGRSVAIGTRAFDVLWCLVRAGGLVVTKETLLDAAWPGLVVEENNISVQIAALRKLLGRQAIGTAPGQGYRLTAVPRAAPPPAPSAPPPSPLHGRESDLRTLSEWLGASALVSVVGTGGVGKTFLARHLVASPAVRRQGGAHWIDLAPVADGTPVAALLAKSLGVELSDSAAGPDKLLAALAGRDVLVALDNCEHLARPVAALVRMALEHAPGVRWLVTSQAPLRVPGELVYRLGPLDLPPDETPPEQMRASGALGLLVTRARAVDHAFALDDADLAPALALCRQLDGLPLAIEMAAPRVAMLGLQAVCDQLGRHLGLLTGHRPGAPRHQSLRQTLAWSFSLLPPAERALFLALQPFRGGFTLEMVQRLGAEGGEAAAVQALVNLIDKSLVHRDAEAPQRFRLLDSARTYALECLREAGQEAAACRRQAEVMAAWFDRAADDHDRLRDDQWLDHYLPERHNVRAALQWACSSGDADLVARLVAAHGMIDQIGGGQVGVLQVSVPADLLRRAAPLLRARASMMLGWAHLADGNRRLGTEFARHAFDDFSAAGDTVGRYRAGGLLLRLYEGRPGAHDEAQQIAAWLDAVLPGDVPLRARLQYQVTMGRMYCGRRTVERLQEWLQLAQRAGFDALACLCHVQITDQLLVEGRFDETASMTQRVLETVRFRPRELALVQCNRMFALVQLGRPAEAAASARAALRAMPGSGYLVAGAFALAAAREQRLVDAALLLGHVLHVYADRDEKPDPGEAAALDEAQARLQLAMEAGRLEDLLACGAGMGASEIVAIALAGC